MPNLSKIIKVTKVQMNTLINGGTIGGYKLSDDVLFAVEDPTNGVNPVTAYLVNRGNYDFVFEEDTGYFVNENAKINAKNSYCIARLYFSNKVAGDITFSYRSYGENNFDYGIFGKLDKELAQSNTDDGTTGSTKVQKNCKGEASTAYKTVTYSNVSAGYHFIDIKYIKDGSGDTNDDTFKFQLQESDIISGIVPTNENVIYGVRISRTRNIGRIVLSGNQTSTEYQGIVFNSDDGKNDPIYLYASNGILKTNAHLYTEGGSIFDNGSRVWSNANPPKVTEYKKSSDIYVMRSEDCIDRVTGYHRSVSSNGKDIYWYRIWASGWLEQGGITSNYGNNYPQGQMLQIPFCDTSYFVVASFQGEDARNDALSIGDKNKYAFNIYNSAGTGKNCAFTWYACGVIDPSFDKGGENYYDA